MKPSVMVALTAAAAVLTVGAAFTFTSLPQSLGIPSWIGSDEDDTPPVSSADDEAEPRSNLNDAELTQMSSEAVWAVTARGCGVGSDGTAWAIDEHHFVTNWHLVANDPSPRLYSSETETMSGEVIGRGVDPDVAVIRVYSKVSAPLSWADSDALTTGQDVVAVGYPATSGDVTATAGTIHELQSDESTQETFGMDGLSDKGNSGGPALTRSGEVAGLISETVSPNGKHIIPVVYPPETVKSKVAAIIASPEQVEADCTAEHEDAEQGWDPVIAPDSSPQAYGDDRFSDDLHDEGQSGDAVACDDLFSYTAYGSDYETFATSCGETDVGTSYGSCSREEMQRLIPLCKDGSMSSCDDLDCDDLDEARPIGADVDTILVAISCGGRYEEGRGPCLDRQSEIVALQDVESECTSGDMGACDDLAEMTGGPLAEVGRTCGGRFPSSYDSCVGRTS